MPLYVKAGAIIPLGPTMQHVNEKKADNLEIRVYPGANGSFDLYEDEGDNYNYEKGVYSIIPFSWDDRNRVLKIGERQGSYPGMLKTRVFRVNAGKKTRAVKYSGSEVYVKIG